MIRMRCRVAADPVEPCAVPDGHHGRQAGGRLVEQQQARLVISGHAERDTCSPRLAGELVAAPAQRREQLQMGLQIAIVLLKPAIQRLRLDRQILEDVAALRHEADAELALRGTSPGTIGWPLSNMTVPVAASTRRRSNFHQGRLPERL